MIAIFCWFKMQFIFTVFVEPYKPIQHEICECTWVKYIVFDFFKLQ